MSRPTPQQSAVYQELRAIAGPCQLAREQNRTRIWYWSVTRSGERSGERIRLLVLADKATELGCLVRFHRKKQGATLGGWRPLNLRTAPPARANVVSVTVPEKPG